MQTHFHYKNDVFYAEAVKLSDLAEQFGTPCYVYSLHALTQQWQAFQKAFHPIKHRVCYAVKANSNIAILNVFAKQGAGFDIVSEGEMARVLAAQGDPKKIIFSGAGKKTAELSRAIDVGIGCFDVESEAELERLQTIAKQKNTTVNVALRVNPDIDAKTHPYIATGLVSNKFGIPFSKALSVCVKTQLMSHIKLTGLACHIGSQITTLGPFLGSIERMLELVADVKASEIDLQHINLGGGLGVRYREEGPPSIETYVKSICGPLENLGLEIIIEPGRTLVAEAGILLTRVEYIKQTPQKNFIITDAGMNDLMRPSLYDAWHEIVPVVRHSNPTPTHRQYDVVGPVCESADFLGKDRALDVSEGDLLAVLTAGAYGSSMSSNYNSRPRAAEVMVDQANAYLIKKRETIQELFSLEKLIG